MEKVLALVICWLHHKLRNIAPAPLQLMASETGITQSYLLPARSVGKEQYEVELPSKYL